jgi:hypothetical protein
MACVSYPPSTEFSFILVDSGQNFLTQNTWR